MSINVTLTHDPAVLMQLRAPWTALHESSANDTIFMTWEWISTWWEHFGAGKTLWLLQATTDEGELVGLAPLMLHSAHETRLNTFKMLSFIGGTDPFDHLDFIIARGRESEVMPAFLSAIQAECDWHVLAINQIPDYSPNLPLLKSRGIPWEYDEDHIAPYVPLTGTWDEFFGTLTKKSRENQRRYTNKLNRAFPDRWHVDMVTEERDIVPTLERMIALHQTQWAIRDRRGSFADPQVVNFHKAVAPKLWRCGWLRLFRLHIDGQIAAAAYTFVYRGRAFGFSMGVDYGIPDVNLGHVLVQNNIRAAVESGLREYDFMWGGEDWKYKWNAVDRIDHTLKWYAATRARMGHGLVKVATDTWHQVKELLPEPLAARLKGAIKGEPPTSAE